MKAISFNYLPFVLRKDDAIRLLQEFKLDNKLPKVNQVITISFPSTNDSPIRGIEISKPTKQHIYTFKFISGNIPLNPDTNLPEKVPMFRNHRNWLTVIPAVWNDVKKNFDDFKVYYTNLEQNKNLSEMDILINSYSYSYMRARNKQGNYYVDPSENKRWTDNTNLPLESLLT